jgi:hypothetical protein
VESQKMSVMPAQAGIPFFFFGSSYAISFLFIFIVESSGLEMILCHP